MFNYSAKQILSVRNFFDMNPNGELKINHPNGFPQFFTKDKWYIWFRESLLHKCGGLRWIDLNERQSNYLSDCRIVKDNIEKRIQRRGRNVLRSPQAKRRYPEVDNNMSEY